MCPFYSSKIYNLNDHIQNAPPDRKLFSKVWSKTQTPVLAVVLTVIISALLGLFSLASLIAVSTLCTEIREPDH